MKDTTNRRARTGECISHSSCCPLKGQGQGGRPERFGDLVAQLVAGVDADRADVYVRDRVDYRVGRLVGKFHLPPEEGEDLSQDLLTALVQAMPRYDARRAKWQTFVNRVLNRRYRYLLRQMLRVENGEIPQTVGFDDVDDCFEESVMDPTRCGGDPAATADLRMDVEAAISTMPLRLQRIARLLMHHPACKVAQLLGTSPAAITRALPRIREYFEAAGL